MNFKKNDGEESGVQASGSLFHCEGDEFAKRLDYSGLVIHNINRVE